MISPDSPLVLSRPDERKTRKQDPERTRRYARAASRIIAVIPPKASAAARALEDVVASAPLARLAARSSLPIGRKADCTDRVPVHTPISQASRTYDRERDDHHYIAPDTTRIRLISEGAKDEHAANLSEGRC